MTGLRLATAAICLGLAATALSARAQPTTAAAATSPPAPAPAPREVDPTAVKALKDMSTYLQSFSAFELTATTSLDLVATNDQKIQMDSVTTYRVRKPNGFVIEVVSDEWNRRYVYDGREFTLYAPKLGYYATWPAPATTRATLDEVEDKFGVSIPLVDLFRWAEPDGAKAEALDIGYLVGTATLDGVKTNHYVFRSGEIDWQIWIEPGAKPLPRKVVIVDRRDPAHPAYVARLSWKLNPRLTTADFAFKPAADAKRIRFASQQEGTTP